MFDLKSFNYSIDDLFLDDKILNTEKYKCKSCKEIIYQKEMYQCKEGDCINCKQCWEKLILEKENLICGVVSFQDLSRLKTLENSFKNKSIYCPYAFYGIDEKVKDKENGCEMVIKVHELQSHKVSCAHRFVNCENKLEDGDGICNYSMRFNTLEEHQNKCPLQILTCELCNKGMIRSIYENHFQLCPSLIVECNQCQIKLERQYLGNHIDNICGQTLIPCKYKDNGCDSRVKRSHLENHLKYVKHETCLSNIIEKQTFLLLEYEKQLYLQNENIKLLSVKIQEYEDKLNQNEGQIKLQNLYIDFSKKKLQESEDKLNKKIELIENNIFSKISIIKNKSEQSPLKLSNNENKSKNYVIRLEDYSISKIIKTNTPFSLFKISNLKIKDDVIHFLKKFPNDSDLLAQHGVILSLENKNKEAEEVFRKAVNADNQNSRAWLTFAEFYEKKNNIIKANEVYFEAYNTFPKISLDKDDLNLLSRYAKNLQKSNEIYKAEVLYKELVSTGLKNSDIFGQYGIFLLEIKKDIDKGGEYLKQAADLKPSSKKWINRYSNYLIEFKKL